MELLFANNAVTSLQSNINALATTVVLATGTGALFPEPGDNQAFYMTFLDAATQQTNEIVLVTNRAGDVCTIVRAQQGTSALTWNAGDVASNLDTAADMAGMVQPDILQKNTYGATHSTGGSANSITATLESGLTALADGMTFFVQAAAENTGAVTLTLTLGTQALAAHSVKKYGGSELNAGDIPAAGFPIQLVWSATLGCYIMVNPASGVAGSVAGGAANDILIQTAPGTTGFVPAPTVAGSVLAFIGGVIAWAAAAVTQFGPAGNKRSGDVTPQAGDYTAAMVGAVPATAFQSPNVQLGNPGFDVLPSGRIYQGGNLSVTPNARTVFTYPKAFPSLCSSIVCSSDNAASAIRVENLNRFTFAVTVNGNSVQWQAQGN